RLGGFQFLLRLAEELLPALVAHQRVLDLVLLGVAYLLRRRADLVLHQFLPEGFRVVVILAAPHQPRIRREPEAEGDALVAGLLPAHRAPAEQSRRRVAILVLLDLVVK